MVDSYPLVRNPTKEAIAKFFLSFGHITQILPIVIIGLIYGNRKIFSKATLLLLFSMIYNTLLKNIFKVPLYPHLGKGYSFPSGHMHAFGLFYGYFLIHIKNVILRTIIIILFIGISISLVYMRYHQIFDVLGALFFLFFELFIDTFLTKNYGEKQSVFAIFAISILSIFGIYLPLHEIQYHIWLAFYAMIGVILSFYIIQINGRQNFLQKSLSLLTTVTVGWFIMKIWKSFKFKQFYLSEVPFFLIPITVVYSLKFSMLVKLPETIVDKYI